MSRTMTCRGPRCHATGVLEHRDAPCPPGWLTMDVLLQSAHPHEHSDFIYHATRITGAVCSQQCLVRRILAMTTAWGIPLNTTSAAREREEATA